MDLKTLRDLLKPVQCTGDAGSITGVAMHSSEVCPGEIFVALPSVWEGKPGGEQYIPQALDKGASVIVTSQCVPSNFPKDRCWIQVQNPHVALSDLAKAFYPTQPRTIMAVTGTNGKTSVADFTFQLWKMAGLPSARMGTIGAIDSFGHDYGESGFTMPNATTLHKTLDEIARNGVQYLALEAASHALVQHRMDNAHVSIAAFTNLTHEHLDYHGDMENYFKAKALLFTKLLPSDGVVVLNKDDSASTRLHEMVSQRVVFFGRKDADISYNIIAKHGEGQDVELSIFGQSHKILFPLIGHFQMSNAACALANAIVSGVDASQALNFLEQLHSVPGRLQKVGSQVYVDYAHSPDALETALTALRPHTKGRLIVIFGCGGNRDPFKRPVMGRIASYLADVVYVTDDNPRMEIPAVIRQEILEQCPSGIEVESRSEAIHQAVAQLRSGDILLIAGKGHETGQIVGTEVQPFNDVSVAKQALGSK